jgi:hypothetical protein
MLMQFPRANNDLLMFAPSIILIPLLLVLDALSDPAKSIKDNLPILNSASIPASLSLCSHIICNTACDLDEVSLAPVASTVRFLFPKLPIYMNYT